MHQVHSYKWFINVWFNHCPRLISYDYLTLLLCICMCTLDYVTRINIGLNVYVNLIKWYLLFYLWILCLFQFMKWINCYLTWLFIILFLSHWLLCWQIVPYNQACFFLFFVFIIARFWKFLYSKKYFECYKIICIFCLIVRRYINWYCLFVYLSNYIAYIIKGTTIFMSSNALSRSFTRFYHFKNQLFSDGSLLTLMQPLVSIIMRPYLLVNPFCLERIFCINTCNKLYT